MVTSTHEHVDYTLRQQRLEAEEDSWLPARKAALIASGDDLGDLIPFRGSTRETGSGKGNRKK